MSPLLLAAAMTAACAKASDSAIPNAHSPTKTYGILILAQDVDIKWRHDLANFQNQLKDHPVESVISARDQISVQRAIDRLMAAHVEKIVAVPLETVSTSTRLEALRYMFGEREKSVADVPDSDTQTPLPPTVASRAARLRSSVPLVLTQAMDHSPLLVDMLADRAKALSVDPTRETLMLVGIGPRSDKALKSWKTVAQEIANKVGVKAGFRKAGAVAVRDGIRSDQQERDRAEFKTALRALALEGRVNIAPLSPEAQRVGQMLKQASSAGMPSYHWNGQGIEDDRRLFDWIKASAEEASVLPDGRQFKDTAPGAGWRGL